MKRVIAAALLCFAFAAEGQEMNRNAAKSRSIAAAETRYMAAMANAQKQYQDAVTAARERFREDLEAAKQDAMKRGKADEVVAIVAKLKEMPSDQPTGGISGKWYRRGGPVREMAEFHKDGNITGAANWKKWVIREGLLYIQGAGVRRFERTGNGWWITTDNGDFYVLSPAE
jgi:hypothetical protein